MPDECRREWEDEQERSCVAMQRLLRRWPNFRQHLVCAQLGVAIADADMMDVDVEFFLAELRKKEPKPAPFVFPKGS